MLLLRCVCSFGGVSCDVEEWWDEDCVLEVGGEDLEPHSPVASCGDGEFVGCGVCGYGEESVVSGGGYGCAGLVGDS